jgi:ribosomal-protein-alanine N-acetyltransferase
MRGPPTGRAANARPWGYRWRVNFPLALHDDLILRLVELDDATALARAYERNRAHLEPWEPVRVDDFYTEAAQRLSVETSLAKYEAGEGLPLVVTSGTEIVGRMTLSAIFHGPFQSARVGYWVDADRTGRGLASAVLRATVDLARDDLGLHRLEASTLVHNLASQRVLDHAGFEQIGLAPHYLQIAGQWQDHKLFQKILHD